MNSQTNQTFDTLAAFQESMLALLNRGERDLIMFDADLQQTGIESIAGIEALQALCQRATLPDCIRILVHNTAFIEQKCPRLLKLYGLYRHRMCIRTTPESYRHRDQPFAMADGQHIVTRFHQDKPRGKLCFDSRPDCVRLADSFESMWEGGQNISGGSALGI